MRDRIKVIFVYLANFVLSISILIILWALNFQLASISSELLAGVFTIIVSAAAVLFTSITDNDELMVAAENANKLTYLMSAFTVPILVSLVGLIASVIAFSFIPPQPILSFSTIFNWILIALVLWASFGFTSAVVIIVILEQGMARERAK
jgi:hypothetical protein